MAGLKKQPNFFGEDFCKAGCQDHQGHERLKEWICNQLPGSQVFGQAEWLGKWSDWLSVWQKKIPFTLSKTYDQLCICKIGFQIVGGFLAQQKYWNHLRVWTDLLVWTYAKLFCRTIVTIRMPEVWIYHQFMMMSRRFQNCFAPM